LSHLQQKPIRLFIAYYTQIVLVSQAV